MGLGGCSGLCFRGSGSFELGLGLFGGGLPLLPHRFGWGDVVDRVYLHVVNEVLLVVAAEGFVGYF